MATVESDLIRHYYGQPGIVARPLTGAPELSFASVVASAADTKIWTIQSRLAELGLVSEAGVVGPMEETVTFPLDQTDKDVSLIPLLKSNSRSRKASAKNILGRINHELTAEIPVAVLFDRPPQERYSRVSRWMLITARKEIVRTRNLDESLGYHTPDTELKSARSNAHFDILDPYSAGHFTIPTDEMIDLIQTSKKAGVIRAIGVDVIGHESPETPHTSVWTP